jgi:membrane-associated protein
MPYPRFLAANITGALIWGAGLVVLGRLAHGHPAIRWAAYAVAGVAILGSLLLPLISWLRGRSQRGPDPVTGSELRPEPQQERQD